MRSDRLPADRRRLLAGTLLLSLPVLLAAAAGQPRYRDPVDLALTPDGGGLAVVCSGTGSLLLLSLPSGEVRCEVPVGAAPRAVALSADGRRAYVASHGDDEVREVDLAACRSIRTLPAGRGPSDVIAGHDGRLLFVSNELSRDVSVVDLASGLETARLRAGERPRALALSAAGDRLYVANLLADPHPPDLPPTPQVTVVDTRRAAVVERVLLPGANVVQGIALTPDGSLLLPLLRPKNLVPLIQVDGGWTMTNGLGLVPAAVAAGGPGGAPPADAALQLLLDSAGRHYADPTAVAVSADGSRAFVTVGGVDRLLVVDLPAFLRVAAGIEPAARESAAERLDLAGHYVRAAVPTGPDPVAVTLSADGRLAYVADRLGDTVTVVDAEAGRAVGTLSLGGPPELTPVRRGERLFYSAAATFHRQFSCASCHPDSIHDGLVYDISPDGLGRNLVDTRTLLGVRGTAPFKWSGLNPDLHTQCGPRAAKFIMRSPGFSAEELDDLVAYESSLGLPRNRDRTADGRLTPLQAWGRRIFERTVDSTGALIPEANRCNFCHSGPRFTNNRSFDVGTRAPSDDSGLFDTPTLNDLADTAPYLHDGRALTLEEIWTRFNPDDRHGRANDLAKDELNALVEYLKSL